MRRGSTDAGHRRSRCRPPARRSAHREPRPQARRSARASARAGGAYPGDRGAGAHDEGEEQDREPERDQRGGARRQVQAARRCRAARRRRRCAAPPDSGAAVRVSAIHELERDRFDEQQSGSGSGERRPDADQDARAPRGPGSAAGSGAGRRGGGAGARVEPLEPEVSTSDIARQAYMPPGERRSGETPSGPGGEPPGPPDDSFRSGGALLLPGQALAGAHDVQVAEHGLHDRDDQPDVGAEPGPGVDSRVRRCGRVGQPAQQDDETTRALTAAMMKFQLTAPLATGGSGPVGEDPVPPSTRRRDDQDDREPRSRSQCSTRSGVRRIPWKSRRTTAGSCR